MCVCVADLCCCFLYPHVESGGGRGSYMLIEVLVISYRERNPTWIHEYDVDIVPLKAVYIHIAYTQCVFTGGRAATTRSRSDMRMWR